MTDEQMFDKHTVHEQIFGLGWPVYLVVITAKLIPADIPLYILQTRDTGLEDPDSDILGLNMDMLPGCKDISYLDCYWNDASWYGHGIGTNYIYQFGSGKQTGQHRSEFRFVLISERAQPAELRDYLIMAYEAEDNVSGIV